MRDRLIELLCAVTCNGDDRREGGCSFRQNDRCNRIEKLDICMIKCIADHLLAKGVIVPPCKVGDKVWCILPIDYDEAYVAEKFVTAILMRDIGLIIRCGFLHFKERDIGKELFFSKEEAEKALAEREVAE